MSGRIARALWLLSGPWLALVLGAAEPTFAVPAECPAAAHPNLSATLIRATFMARGAEGSSPAAFSTDKDQEVTLTFPTPALPPGATVTGAELWLHVSEPRGNPSFTIAVENSGQSFGTRNLSKLRLGQVAIWRASDSAINALKLGGNISLKLKALGLNADVQTPMWDSPAAAQSAFRPRLIVTYKVPIPQPQQALGLPGAVSAAPVGIDLNAFALSGHLDFLLEGSKGVGTVAYPLTSQGAVYSQTPVLGTGLFYIITKDSNNAAALEARSSLTGAAIWSVPVQDPSPYVLADSLGAFVYRREKRGPSLPHRPE